MRKIFTFVILLFASVVTANAAVASGTCGTNLTWTVNTKDSTLVIEGYGPMDASSPFSFAQYNSYVKYLYLPEGMTAIGYEAFKYFSNLLRVNIPSSVVKSGNGAFKNCEKLDSVLITDIASWCAIDFYWDKYYNGATSNPLVYAEHLYLNGEKVTDLVIPDSVKIIGNYAFTNCTDLETLVLQEGDSLIGKHAFMGCTSLNSVSFPTSLKYVNSGAFSGCEQVTGVHITDLAAWSGVHFGYTYGYDSISNPLYYAKNLYLNGEKVTRVELPEGIERIGQCAFLGCSDLTHVILPGTINFIEDRAFRHCNNIVSFVVGALTPPDNGRNCGIRNTSCTLYVPEESVETYANSVWWEDFFDIQPISNYGTGMDNIASNKSNASKVVCDGVIYIQRGDKTYTIQGTEIR